MLPGCFKASLRIFKASGMFQEGSNNASRILQGCFKIAYEKCKKHSAVLKSVDFRQDSDNFIVVYFYLSQQLADKSNLLDMNETSLVLIETSCFN
jgi:hypothetical protein